MSFRFEIEATDGKARAGRMVTPHGAIETPVFMPVGTLAGLSRWMAELGRRGGSAVSKRKAAAARANRKKGGRPKLA